MIAITQPQLHILCHALGKRDDRSGREYRNHFVTEPGSVDFQICNELVAAGLMYESGSSVRAGEDHLFHVTEEGKELVRAQPSSRRLTRHEQLYREFLALDGGMTFKEFLKARWAGRVETR